MAKAAGAAIPAALGLGSTASAIGGALGAGAGALMSKGGGGATQQVNPQALAGAQTQSNIATAETQAALNNAAVYSPFGVSGWTPGSIDPNTGMPSTYALNQSLSGPLQQLFNSQTGLTQALAGGAAGQLLPQGLTLADMARGPMAAAANIANNQIQPTLDLSAVPNIAALTPGAFRTGVTTGAGGQALPGVQTAVGGPQAPVQTSVDANFPQLVKQAQDAAYQQQTQYLDPQFTQSRQQLTQQLADQGLQPGTEAYDRALGDFNRQQQMAYQSAQTSAVQAGNAQQQALFGQSLGAGQFANQAAGQLFQQGMAGSELTNQAQQQMFGQGFNLANLYNQSVQGASTQNLQAQAANLQRAQAGFGAPITAANAQLGIGQGLFGTGQNVLPTLAGLTGIAPTWPLSIPTMGGQQTTVPPTNLANIQAAATGQNRLAYGAGQQNISNLLGGANIGSQLLTGQTLGQALGQSGGLFGLIGGGGNNFQGTGLSAGDVASLSPNSAQSLAAFNAAGGYP